MLGVFAEFERAILQERIHPGIARARKNGTKSGKPIGRARTNAKVEDAIRASLAAGKGIHRRRGNAGSGPVSCSGSGMRRRHDHGQASEDIAKWERHNPRRGEMMADRTRR
jgi:DNA invertase Pin-like site-specific DNA recombinase